MEPDEIRRLALRCSVATLTTQLFSRGIRHSGMDRVAPLTPGMRMAGWAYTLRYVPAREDLDVLAAFRDPDHPQRYAVEHAPVGHVLVIDARGITNAAAIGAILVTRLEVRGAAGVVTDGVVRDAAGIRATGLPVFAHGAHPATNLTWHHAVDVNVPIGCGGVLVEPGDLVVGDDDGVVVVPRALGAEVVTATLEQDRLEEFLRSKVKGGARLGGTYPPGPETMAEYRAVDARGEQSPGGCPAVNSLTRRTQRCLICSRRSTW